MNKGKLFVISAPAGTGKTTLAEAIVNRSNSKIIRSISCTTREPRGNEKDGVDYFFISKQEFETKLSNGAFLEYAQVFEHYYGTLQSQIEEKTHAGINILLVIDVQGALQVKKKTHACLIFIAPPSIEELKNRLTGRGTDSDESIQLRLSQAKEEMKMAKEYDYVIINDKLSDAVMELETAIQNEIQKE